MMFEKVRVPAAVVAAVVVITVSGLAVYATGRSSSPARAGEEAAAPAKVEAVATASIPLRMIELEADHLLNEFEELLSEQSQIRKSIREARREKAAQALREAEAELKE